MDNNHIIIGIHVTQRQKQAGDVQTVLTRFGENIRTRLGLHDVEEHENSSAGLMLIEFVGSEENCAALESQLSQIGGVDTQKMVFPH